MTTPYYIILASGSPRRRQLFKDLGIDVEIRSKAIKENYPKQLIGREITDYVAQKKALSFKGELTENDLLITSDTIVWHNNRALGKPKHEKDAYKMLTSLSGNMHEVITSVCFTTLTFQKTVNTSTKVYFKTLSSGEITYYIKNYQPFDKAGAYAIQEWIGHIGIEKIEGSYTNVMGLPTHLVYKTLMELSVTPKPNE
jgi:septum formation protein